MSEEGSVFEKIFKWSFKIGRVVGEKDTDLLRMLIFEIRGEETPGIFLNKLANRLAEYKTNKRIDLDLSLPEYIYTETWYADKFYYMKSAIISGFLNALSSFKKEGSHNIQGDKS